MMTRFTEFVGYRVEFGGEQIDYHSNFAECQKYAEVIKFVLQFLKGRGVEHCWYFYEPYVEITWVADVDLLQEVVRIVEAHHDGECRSKKGTDFLDWYHGGGKHEEEFSWRRYAAITDVSMLFREYRGCISDGKGQELHYVRCAHVLANQLAMNYKQEGKALIKRGILCLLFWWLGHKKAVWIWTKVFRARY